LKDQRQSVLGPERFCVNGKIKIIQNRERNRKGPKHNRQYVATFYKPWWCCKYFLGQLFEGWIRLITI